MIQQLTPFLVVALLSLPLAAQASGAQDPGAQDLATHASDRVVAHWVVELGGTVELAGHDQRFRSVAELPLEDYRLTLVDLVGTNISPPDLEKLSKLTALKRLVLPGPMWNPSAGARTDYSEDLKHLANLPTLEELIFSGTYLESIKFQDEGLAKIKALGPTLKKLSLEDTQVRGRHLSEFKQLRSLDLVYCPIDDKGAEQLKGLTNLRELLLRDAIFSDAAMPNLSELVQLQRLDLGGVKISDAGLTSLAGLTQLRKLNLQGTRLTDASASWLGSLSALEELDLYGTRLGNVGIESLKLLKNLRWIDLRYTKVTQASVDLLRKALPNCSVVYLDLSASSQLPMEARRKVDRSNAADIARWVKDMGGDCELRDGQIVSLSLSKTGVTDEMLANIADLQQLQQLDLTATEISDLGLVHLAKLTQLRALDLSFTSVTDAGLTHLQALPALRRLALKSTQVSGQGFSDWPKERLENLALANCPVTDKGLETIVQMTTLSELGLSYSDITDRGLVHLKQLPNLAWLDLDGTDISDASVDQLGEHKRLEHLLMSYTKISDKAMRHIGQLAQLKSFTAVRTRLTDKGMEALGKLEHLEAVELDYTDVGDAGLKHFDALKQLRRISLDSSNVGDGALDSLLLHKRLRYLNLYHTFVTPNAFEKLRSALPDCEIIFEAASADAKRRRS